ncbi:MAG: DUF1631 family protein, partial [Ramlibacter sp.]|nr:DUF1631 family protein [Ramlibacter sp.]
MPFQQYLDQAVAESTTLIARSITQAVRSMAQASVTVTDQVERNRLANTAEALQKAAQATTDAFPAALRQELEAASSTTASPAKALSFDSLELMAEDQLDDTVELLRGEQAVKAAVEADLVALNALVSAAQGHERVTTIANPLRPEVWVRAFHRALEKAKAPAAARASWMLHVGRAL